MIGLVDHAKALFRRYADWSLLDDLIESELRHENKKRTKGVRRDQTAVTAN